MADETETERVALARQIKADRLAWLRAQVKEDEQHIDIAVSAGYLAPESVERERGEVAFKRNLLEAATTVFADTMPHDGQGRELSHPIARAWFRTILTGMAHLYANLGRAGYREELWPW